MKKIVSSFFVFIIFQSSVFAIGTKSTMNKVMGSWKGESINSVIEKWGYPSEEKTFLGRKLFYWTDNQFACSSTQYGVYIGEEYCTRIFEIDDNNSVVKWQWKGNNCPTTYFTSKKWVNPKNNPWRPNNKL